LLDTQSSLARAACTKAPSYLDKTLKAFGINIDQPQGLGGALGRGLGLQPYLDQQSSNRLVNLGLGMMAAGPTVGVKGFPGAMISGLTSFGKGGQFALNQEQQDRTQAINLANAAMNQRLHEAQIQHLQQETKKPFVVGTETIYDQYGMPHYRNRMGVPDPNSPNGYRELPSTEQGAPSGQAAEPPSTLEALQKSVSPSVWDSAVAVADYDKAPFTGRYSQPGTPGGLIMQTARRIAQMRGEEYDEGTYGAKKQAQKVLTSGIDSRMLANGSTAIGHFHDIVQSVDKLDPGQYPMKNQFMNWLSTQAGHDATKSYNSNAGLLAEELTSFYRGIGGAEADIKRELDNLNPSLSLEQQRGVVGKMASMINSKLNALETKRDFAFGKNAETKFPLLNNPAKQELAAIEEWARRDPNDRSHVRDVKKGGNAPQAAPSLPTVKNDADFEKLPSGTRFIDPEGNTRVKP
jgi:hypothetical protein